MPTSYRSTAAALLCGAALAGAPGYVTYDSVAGTPYTVTYDNRSIFINGQRSMFASFGLHYPRFTPAQWDDMFLKAVADGYNMLQTYVFVNAHAPKMQWPWIMDGNVDLRLFIQKAAAAGLFVNLRIGPYVCAEWSWGGYPYNLARVPDLVSRSSSPAWEAWMSQVVLNTTALLRDLFADKGGPIIIAQVENELHTGDQAYVDFCGELAMQAMPDIPWEMCNGNAANTTINSCNGGDCTSFIESNGQNGLVLINQPALWTENWMGWFASWGDGGPAGGWPNYDSTGQSASKSAGIMRWFARGGSHVNFYMWAGGNHFGRNAGSSMVNMYYWDSPIASDGLEQGPERRHMARTFAAIASVASTMLAYPAQVHQQVQVPYYSNGQYSPGDAKHIGFVYKSSGSGPDVAFFENDGSTADFSWNGFNYTVAGGTVSLVLSNGTTVFNSGDVLPTGLARTWTAIPGAFGAWQTWSDPVVPVNAGGIPAPTAPRTPWTGSALGAVIASSMPLEAVNFTEYDTELGFYVTQVSAATMALARAAGEIKISLASAKAQAWTAFVNGVMVGTGEELSHGGGGATVVVTANMSGIPAGAAVLTLLSTSVGIDNGGGINNQGSSFSSTGVKGITSQAAGAVMFGSVDITSAATWTHIVGTVGEVKAVYTSAGAATVTWTPVSGATLPPMSWLRVNFTAPPEVLAPPAGVEVNLTLNLDVTGLSRGFFFVNGFNLGRFWSRMCGGQYMCQRYYSIPFDLLLPGEGANTLVILDEMGVTNASGIALAVSGNLPPPPPPPCAPVPPAGAPAVMTACGNNGSVWTAATSTSPGAVTLSLTSVPNMCLGINSESGPFGSPSVGVVPCNGSDARQAWILPPTGASQMTSMGYGTSKCLDIGGQNSSYGAALDMWSCNAGSNQAWTWNAAAGTIISSLNAFCAGLC